MAKSKIFPCGRLLFGKNPCYMYIIYIYVFFRMNIYPHTQIKQTLVCLKTECLYIYENMAIFMVRKRTMSSPCVPFVHSPFCERHTSWVFSGTKFRQYAGIMLHLGCVVIVQSISTSGNLRCSSQWKRRNFPTAILLGFNLLGREWCHLPVSTFQTRQTYHMFLGM